MKKKTGSSRKSGTSKSAKDLRPRLAKEKSAKGVRGGMSDFSATKTLDSKSSSLSNESVLSKQTKLG